MKKKCFLLLAFVISLLFPFAVNAKEKVYNICKEGCEYDRLLPVMVDINFLKEDYDVIVNFKDSGPYYYIEDETDYLMADTAEEGLCENIGGEYFYGDCYVNGESVNNNEFFSIVYIANPNLSSVTLNGVEEKTEIKLSPFIDSSEFLMAFSFPGVLFTNFTLNNMKYDSSVYFASNQKPVEGTLNNCEIRHAILTYGTVTVTVENSNINNVYALGSEEDETGQYLGLVDAGNSLVIIKDKSNTFAHTMFKYSEQAIREVESILNQYKAEHPAPQFNESYPIRENGESYASYRERLDEYYARRNAWWSIYDAWNTEYFEFVRQTIASKVNKNYFSIEENDVYDFIADYLSSLTGSSFNTFREHYLEYEAENPCPPALPYPNRNQYATDEAYEEAYNAYLEREHERYEWSLELIDDAYDYAADIFATSGESLLRIITKVLFGDDGDASNLFELGGGRIVFSEYKTKTTTLSNHLDLKAISEELQTDISGWQLSQDGIIEIRNGEIIPLQVGEVEIKKIIGDNIYTVKIVITPDMINPYTGQNKLIILLAAVTLLIGAYVYKQKRRA